MVGRKRGGRETRGTERVWEREGVEREGGTKATAAMYRIHLESKFNVKCSPDNQIKSVWCLSVIFPITSHYVSVSVSVSLSVCLSVCLSVRLFLCVVSLSNYLEHITAHHLFIRAISSLSQYFMNG